MKVKSQKYQFRVNSEFDHSFEVTAESPEGAYKKAMERCEAGENAPGVFIDHISVWLWTEGLDGEPERTWELNDNVGELVETTENE